MAEKRFTQKDIDDFALTYQLYIKLTDRVKKLNPEARTKMEIWINKTFDNMKMFAAAARMARENNIPFNEFLEMMAKHQPGEKARDGLGAVIVTSIAIAGLILALSAGTATMIVAYNMSKGDRLRIQEAHVDELKRMLRAGEISQQDFNMQMGKIAGGAVIGGIPWWGWLAGGALLIGFGLPAGRREYTRVSEKWKTGRSRRKLRRAEEKLARLQEGAYEPA